MNIEIRKATTKDLQDIQELNYKLFEQQYNYDKDLILNWPLSEQGKEYFKNLIENEIVYIAIDNNKSVGYLAGSLDNGYMYSNKKVAEINNMFVNEEYRGQHIGTKLINLFKDECKAKNINVFNVNAYWLNESAIKFYERNGFAKLDITLQCKGD